MNNLILEHAYEWLLLNTNYYIYQAKHNITYYLYDTNGNYTVDKKKICNLNIIYINDDDYYDIDIFNDMVVFSTCYPYEEQRYYISELEDICSTEESYFQYSILKSPILQKTDIEYLIKIMNKLYD